MAQPMQLASSGPAARYSSTLSIIRSYCRLLPVVVRVVEPKTSFGGVEVVVKAISKKFVTNKKEKKLEKKIT